MADAVTAPWHGNNYQARVFWWNAFDLLRPDTCVVEVTFEASAPMGFDDVVVKFDPPVPRSGPQPVSAEYYQVKWHVQHGRPFGYESLADPAFIGAKTSLLERLRNARRTAPASAHFVFQTTDRIQYDDPLSKLISGNDKTLLIEKLFHGTTDMRAMGAVRKCWREHLNLATDDELATVVQGLRIFDNGSSLDRLRDDINLKALALGLRTFSAAHSDFRYDELARQMKIRRLNKLTRETFLQLCRDEGLLVERPAESNVFFGRLIAASAAAHEPVARPAEPDPFLPVAIRSFLGLSADLVVAAPEDTLLLTDDFRQRYLQEDREWQRDIRPRVEAFLRGAVKKSFRLRLILDAHASIAFLAGAVFDLKSGVQTQLVQKGRVGPAIWHADDGSAAQGERFHVATEALGAGREIAIAVSASQDSTKHARAYIEAKLPDVGTLVSFDPPAGPGQQSVMGGGHAAALAEQVSNHVRGMKVNDPDAVLHIFAACPNSLLFFLGQHHQGIAPCIVYEFDFDRRAHKTYQPSFEVD